MNASGRERERDPIRESVTLTGRLVLHTSRDFEICLAAAATVSTPEITINQKRETEKEEKKIWLVNRSTLK